MISEANYKENAEKTFIELEEYTRNKVPHLKPNYEELSFIYEQDDLVLGRIVGKIHWDHLQIELFSVHSNSRGKGVGSKLLHHIETIAQEKGLSYVSLETMSFNAPKFYEKNGYKVFGKIENSPYQGSTRYFFKKTLPNKE
ncbi:hypothetical protein N692_11500 [Lactiplantibacillus plantarum EGD-AQ4]|nr:hypothetical protein N692_11500 [Lactiplantibacillus plantarum EGD-AQ4]